MADRRVGLLTTLIAITNTHSVGVVRDVLAGIHSLSGAVQDWRSRLVLVMPAVAETYDGVLNDIDRVHMCVPAHVEAAYDQAVGGPVAEGSVGGGTGLICHAFKGYRERVRGAAEQDGGWRVGVLVQADHAGVGIGGSRRSWWPCRTGRSIWRCTVWPASWIPAPDRSSLSSRTDGALVGDQCRRSSGRPSASAGLGGGTSHSSGDIFPAFSTAGQGTSPDNFMSGATTAGH